MAEGILQILENIYHSEYQRGYFCFRIHNDTRGRSEAYLRKEYPAYMASRDERHSQTLNYLEVKVADFSHQTIPAQFYKSLSRRMERADKEEKSIYQKILSEAADLKLSSFYDETTEFWRDYNALPENIIHHYGIPIFQSLIACCHGYFRVNSRSTAEVVPERECYSMLYEEQQNAIAIPGTQYDALLPLGNQDRMQNISMDVNLRYNDHLLEEYNICKNGICFNAETIRNIPGIEGGQYSFQEKKELSVRMLENDFEISIEGQMSGCGEKLNGQEEEVSASQNDQTDVIHISADNIAITMIEIFCKTLMLYIAKKGQSRDCYIMITECTQSHFVELARMMALFYNKLGENPLMKRTQIYMSGTDESEEFLITGENLAKAVAGTEKLAFARSVHPNCLNSLRRSLKNHMMTGKASPNEIINIVPFDMIKYPGATKTLMERRMQNVLKQNVQSELFGCRLENLHVRIGSKIHVRTFYEAELLFHNNYYTLRFAYWLYNELHLDERLKKDEPFVLVGYENYSEMLINELYNMLVRDDHTKSEYIIYEERSAGKFRGKIDFARYKDMQFVIIIPINSTTTTHIKVAGFLEKTIRNSLKSRDNSGSIYHIDRDRVLNYGVVLIASNTENMYWERCHDEENVIISKIDGKKLKYYVEVQAQWESPLQCKACFPNEDYTTEQPLIETNKESVVPMHAIGIRRPHPMHAHGIEEIQIRENQDGDALSRLSELTEILTYRHVERNGNHFNYYFCTERLWENERIKCNVEEWLKERGGTLFEAKEYKVYDIIVAPLHYSNTVFVEEVNNYLFSNAALVLHFDADKEFRMNVRSKYSAVQQLYDNLQRANEKALINFHYIDDTITSGHTYHRMKSLIRSLIQEEKSSLVEINIFKSIVLLINRMSTSSIRDYIEDTTYFMAYFNLAISSMRVNSDACVLCKKYWEWIKLSEQASLNDVNTFWRDKSELLECIPAENLDHPVRGRIRKKGNTAKTLGDTQHSARAAQYMMASHRAKRLLGDICYYADIDEIMERIVEVLFPKSVFPSMDGFVAMLKILCRPFMTFRKEEKEAVFKLVLIMLDELLGGERPRVGGKLQNLLGEIYDDVPSRIKMVELLINRLAELESNFIIRKRNMDSILDFASQYADGEEQYESFANNYLNRIKQLTGQSNDFSKGLYLEYLLLYGKEYDGSGCTNMDMSSLTGDDRKAAFGRKVYLENTKLANYGIEYLADCFWGVTAFSQESMLGALNDNYYFDNFIQYLAFHKAIIVNEKERVECFVSQEEYRKLVGMVQFELLYQQIFGRKKIAGYEVEEPEEKEEMQTGLRNKFAEMLEYLKAASGALDGEIIVPYEMDRKYMKGVSKYIALGLGKGTDIRSLENNEQQLADFMQQERKFEGDTYAICSSNGTNTWVLLKFYERTEVKSEDMSVIYMLLPFHTDNKEKLLHALKNILLFRNKIWKILNLSSDVLLKNLTDNLFYKQQMLKSRAGDHSEFCDNKKKLDDISRYVTKGYYDRENKEELRNEVIKNYFELLINNMIGFMNTQALGGKGADYALYKKTETTFEEFWNMQYYIIQAASIIWNFKITLGNEKKLNSCIIRRMDDRKTPFNDVLLTLFLAVFQNVQKHGKRNAADQCEISIYADGEHICIMNNIADEENDHIKEMIKPKAYRIGDGISLAVICDICWAHYPETRYEELFSILSGKSDEKGGIESFFVVKLPVIEVEPH